MAKIPFFYPLEDRYVNDWHKKMTEIAIFCANDDGWRRGQTAKICGMAKQKLGEKMKGQLSK
ncbi:hypothetical protein SJI19_13895 [Acerihabitans sp. TG2]|uniref:hypothetical protein n=1 Tax=Acerihabitans sp. TG2 TaxID=3096008 RepID=UPI002B2350AB|nr:hypothetical protein [Acerihabitans sp. TG2]MEA9391623.1 hypothetical protein [Acerihabitans sp. TG2]